MSWIDQWVWLRFFNVFLFKNVLQKDILIFFGQIRKTPFKVFSIYTLSKVALLKMFFNLRGKSAIVSFDRQKLFSSAHVYEKNI
jgi:hypothetical protein